MIRSDIAGSLHFCVAGHRLRGMYVCIPAGINLVGLPYSVVEHYCRFLDQMDVEVGDESIRLRGVCRYSAEPNLKGRHSKPWGRGGFLRSLHLFISTLLL